MNIVKIQKRIITNRNNYEQFSITIPTPIAKKLDGVKQMNIQYNEERRIIECIPILEE